MDSTKSVVSSAGSSDSPTKVEENTDKPSTLRSTFTTQVLCQDYVEIIQRTGIAPFTVVENASEDIKSCLLANEPATLYLLHDSTLVGRCTVASVVRKFCEIPPKTKELLPSLPSSHWQYVIRVEAIVVVPWSVSHEIFSELALPCELPNPNSPTATPSTGIPVKFADSIPYAFYAAMLELLVRWEAGLGFWEKKASVAEVIHELECSSGPKKLASYINALREMDTQKNDLKQLWLLRLFKFSLIRLSALSAPGSDTFDVHLETAVLLLLVIRATLSSEYAVAAVCDHLMCPENALLFFLQPLIVSSITRPLFCAGFANPATFHRLVPLRIRLVRLITGHIGSRILSYNQAVGVFLQMLEQKSNRKRPRSDDEVADECADDGTNEWQSELWLEFFCNDSDQRSIFSPGSCLVLEVLLPILFQSLNPASSPKRTWLAPKLAKKIVESAFLNKFTILALSVHHSTLARNFITHLGRTLIEIAPSKTELVEWHRSTYLAVVESSLAVFQNMIRRSLGREMLLLLVDALMPKPEDDPAKMKHLIVDRFCHALEEHSKLASSTTSNNFHEVAICVARRCCGDKTLAARMQTLARQLNKDGIKRLPGEIDDVLGSESKGLASKKSVKERK